MLHQKLWLALGVSGLVVGSYAVAQTDVKQEVRSPTEAAMHKMMGDEAMMTKVQAALLADNRFSVMLAHEMMVQKMLQDKPFMTRLRLGLKKEMGTHEMEIKMDIVDIDTNKMMSDQAANQRVLKDLMIRQLVAAEMEKQADSHETR